MGAEIRTLSIQKDSFPDLGKVLQFVAETVAQENLVNPQIHIYGNQNSSGNREWFEVQIEGVVRVNDGERRPDVEPIAIN